MKKLIIMVLSILLFCSSISANTNEVVNLNNNNIFESEGEKIQGRYMVLPELGGGVLNGTYTLNSRYKSVTVTVGEYFNDVLRLRYNKMYMSNNMTFKFLANYKSSTAVDKIQDAAIMTLEPTLSEILDVLFLIDGTLEDSVYNKLLNYANNDQSTYLQLSINNNLSSTMKVGSWNGSTYTVENYDNGSYKVVSLCEYYTR